MDVSGARTCANTKVVEIAENKRIIKYNRDMVDATNWNTVGQYKSLVYINDKLVCVAPPKSASFSSIPETMTQPNVEHMIDGTMVNVFWDPSCLEGNGDWNLTTRSVLGGNGTFFRRGGGTTPTKTFRHMFLECMEEQNINFTDFEKEFVYSFVMQHPEARIVEKVEKPRLCLVEMYKINSEDHIECYPMSAFSSNPNELMKLSFTTFNMVLNNKMSKTMSRSWCENFNVDTYCECVPSIPTEQQMEPHVFVANTHTTEEDAVKLNTMSERLASSVNTGRLTGLTILDQLEYESMRSNIPDYFGFIPTSTTYSSLEQVVTAANELPYYCPGLIIRDDANPSVRYAIRNPAYDRVRELRGHQPNPEFRVLELLNTQTPVQLTEYLHYFDEHRPIAEYLYTRRTDLVNRLMHFYKNIFIFKNVTLKMAPFELKPHLYALQGQYIETLSKQGLRMTPDVIYQYIVSLPAARLLFTLNAQRTEHVVEFGAEHEEVSVHNC